MQETKRADHLCTTCERGDCPATTSDDIPVTQCRKVAPNSPT